MLDATTRAVELTARRPSEERGSTLGAERAMGWARRDGAGKERAACAALEDCSDNLLRRGS